jgi:dienelactone hydrolase
MISFKNTVFAGLFFGALLTGSAPALAERPLADFARVPALQGPELSPSGRQVAALTIQQDQLGIQIFNIDGTGKSVFLTAGDGDVFDLTWVNDEWLIAMVGHDTRDWTQYAVKLVAFRSDGTKMHFVERKDVGVISPRVVWTANDGSPRILMSSAQSLFSTDKGYWSDVYMVDLAKNSFDKVVYSKEGVRTWYADGKGVVRVGIGMEQGGKRQRLMYRNAESDGFKEVASASTNGKEELLVPKVFLPEAGKAATFSNRNGFDALYVLDLAEMKTGSLLYDVPGYDLDAVIPDATKTKIRGVRYTDTQSRVVWFDPALQQIQASVEKSLPGRSVSIVSMSANERTMILHAGSPSTPGSYYALSLDAGRLSLLGHSNPAIGEAELAPVKTIQYTARDGLKMSAVLTVPAGKAAKNLPLIVLPHGGPQARDEEAWDFWTQFLADRGYAVLQPNYRGSSGFGKAFLDAGDGQWGLKMQDDVDDARAWAISSGLADEKRVCIAGGSYGGYVAMRAAERNPDLYRCAISFAGVSDLPAILSYDSKFIDAQGNYEYWKSRVTDLRAVSPINNAERTGIPILVIHGEKDLRVPIAQSKTYVDKLRKAGKTVEFFVQPKGDHHFTREEDRFTFLTQMEAFLDKYNPAN